MKGKTIMSEKMKNRVKIQDVRFVEAKCMECGKEYMVIYKFKSRRFEVFGDFPCECGRKGFYLVHEEDPLFKDWYEEQVALREQAIAEHRCNSRGYIYYE